MKKVAIIGAGLSGLMTANLIKEYSNADVTIFEKGLDFSTRLLTESPNLISGIGGAGTLFGGKLCFPPASSGVWNKSGISEKGFNNFVSTCIKPFISETIFLSSNLKKINFLSPMTETILKEKLYPSLHLNKIEMNCFVSNVLNSLKNNSVLIKSECEFISAMTDGDKYILKCTQKEKIVNFDFDILVYATGRSSAMSIANWLPPNSNIIPQSPDLGLRFSINLSECNFFSEIGKDVKFKATFGDIGVRTFCVCSGGDKAIVNLNGTKYYDGHFDIDQTDISNVGILARSPQIIGSKAAMAYCASLEKYIYSDLTMKDFILYSNKFISETNKFDPILDAIRDFILLLQNRGILGSNLDNYPVWLPSIDRLNSLVQTDENFRLNHTNIYVVGDAAGLSRGFLQSMWTAYCASNDIAIRLDESQEILKEKII